MLWGCRAAPVKRFQPGQLAGSWRLIQTRDNNVVRDYPAGTLLYEFDVDGRVVSRIKGKVFRGLWKLKGSRLYAWWPDRHRENHRIVALSSVRLVLLSRDGRLLSTFKRIR